MFPSNLYRFLTKLWMTWSSATTSSGWGTASCCPSSTAWPPSWPTRSTSPRSWRSTTESSSCLLVLKQQLPTTSIILLQFAANFKTSSLNVAMSSWLIWVLLQLQFQLFFLNYVPNLKQLFKNYEATDYLLLYLHGNESVSRHLSTF